MIKFKRTKYACGAVLTAASISMLALPHTAQASHHTLAAGSSDLTLRGLSGRQGNELTAVQALAQLKAAQKNTYGADSGVFKADDRHMSAKADIGKNRPDKRTEKKEDKRHKQDKQDKHDKDVFVSRSNSDKSKTSGSISSRIEAILKSDDNGVFKPAGDDYDLSYLGEDSIMGRAVATPEQCVRYLLEMNPHPKISVSPQQLVDYYYEEAGREGIRPDAAFAQALKETGYFNYGGTVTPDQNNYCGLGTTSATVKGAYFDTAQMGVRAHIQHLLAYSSVRPPREDVVDPRYSLVRSAYAASTIDTWQGLNGRWAVPGNNYGQEILQIVNRMARE